MLQNKGGIFPAVSVTENKVVLSVPGLEKSCRLFLIGDYHSTLSDEREIPFRKYSARMAQYGHHDMTMLEEFFRQAQSEKCDAILLLGDMISFPSQAGVESLERLMKSSPVPCYFTAGNHDWHYEGTAGSDMEQRRQWINERLKSLYQGRDPMNYAVEVNGLRILMMDNSVYEILPSQLAFLENELARGANTLVACHIPFHLPGTDRSVTSYGCGHPRWCEASDPYYEIEQRQPWAKEGLSQTAFDFCSRVLSAENVLGIVAGHTHRFMTDVFSNKIQLVVSSQKAAVLELKPFQQ